MPPATRRRHSLEDSSGREWHLRHKLQGDKVLGAHGGPKVCLGSSPFVTCSLYFSKGHKCATMLRFTEETATTILNTFILSSQKLAPFVDPVGRQKVSGMPLWFFRHAQYVGSHHSSVRRSVHMTTVTLFGQTQFPDQFQGALYGLERLSDRSQLVKGRLH